MPVALAVAALILVAATLHLRVTPVKLTPPVAALLYPYGDVSGDVFSQNKTLYVNGRYATIVAMGRVALYTNTSGWYVLVPRYALPPVGASRELPGAGECVATPLDNGAFLELYNYNNESGVAALLRGSIRYVWAAKILKAGDYYIWYPAVPTRDIYNFVVGLGPPPIYVAVPRRDYVSIGGHTVCFYADYFNGTYDVFGNPIWIKKASCFGFDLMADFKPLSLMGYADGLEWRDGVYIYWPVVVAYLGNESTYLRAEGR